MINDVGVVIVGGSLSALRTRGLGPRKPKPSNHGPRSSSPDVTRAWRFEPRWLILFYLLRKEGVGTSEKRGG